jgi:P27 family predicted phage terminase small subunit
MPGDREVLAMFCVAVDHAHRAARLVGEAGLLVRGQRGSEVVKNPAESMARANARLVTTLAAELGLTPTSRARIIQGVAQIDDPYDDAARLLS